MKYIIFFTGIMLLSGCASTQKVPIDIETEKSLTTEMSHRILRKAPSGHWIMRPPEIEKSSQS